MNDNARLAQELVTAFSRGDLEAVYSFFAADAVWELPGRSAITGTFKGPEEIVGFLARSFELSGGTLALELIDVLGSEWGAVQVQRVSAHRDDKVLDCVEVIAHEIVNGKIIHTYHRPDQYAIDAFFG